MDSAPNPVTKALPEKAVKRAASVWPPEASARSGYKYCIFDERVVEKQGIFCGWKLAQSQFLSGWSWRKMVPFVRGFENLERAVGHYFQQHDKRYTVLLHK